MMRMSTLIVIATAFAGSANASSISGSFDLNGSFTFTTSSNSITWTSASGLADQATIGNDVTGSFAGLGGTAADIENLSFATVGAPFAAQDFINFIAAPTIPTLDVTYIDPGIGGTAGCTAAPAAGQTCTPSGSPFTFINTSAGTSLVTFDFRGVTSDGNSSWNGIFTSQFNESYQSVLSGLASNGSFAGDYSDSNTVLTLTPVPLPGTGGLVVMGLLLLTAAGMRFQPLPATKKRPA